MDGLHSPTTARGFSLIEIAVVLFIVGLVMSGTIAFLNSMVMNRQIETTKAKQEAIKTALISFIARNNRMPCPARPNLAEGVADNGVEARDIPNKLCTGLSPVDQVVTGVVPWVSLGLTNENALDAYGNRFTYQVVLSAAFLERTTISGMNGRITIHSAGPGSLGLAPAGNQTNYCSGAVNPCAAVAVVVSHGKDGYGAYTRAGLRMQYSPTEIFPPEVTGNDARENTDANSKFVSRDFSDVTTNPFDDIVMVLTTNDLLSPLVIGGTLKDYTATLNAKFDVIKGAVIADAYKGGGNDGKRFYMLPLSTSPITDPWNKVITYQRNFSQRIDCDSTSGPAFSLISGGPDGDFGTLDDNISHSVSVDEIRSIIATTGCNK